MDLIIIQQKIFEVRGQKIMFDFDLAELYETETRILNQTVKRNLERFPVDFMFRLTSEEWQMERSQIVDVSKNVQSNSSQIVMSSNKHRGALYLPYAFTEHGVTMLASILRSDKAIQMNIAIVRAFIALRQLSMHYKGLAEKLAELENDTNKKFGDIYQALNFLLDKKKKDDDFAKRERIGFRNT